MRILLVSQMYPGPSAPGLGTFVAELEAALEARGHTFARAVVDRRGGPAAPRARSSPTRRSPRGGSGPTSSTPTSCSPPGCGRCSPAARRSCSRRTGRTSRTPVRSMLARAATHLDRAPRRTASSPSRTGSATVSARPFRRQPESPRGGRLRRRRRRASQPRDRPRRVSQLGLPTDGTGLPLRRVAERAQERARPRPRGRAARPTGRSSSSARARCARRSRAARASSSPATSHRDGVARWLAAADVVCQPSLVEPFGLAALEGMASGRSVVGTTVGGHARVHPGGARVRWRDPGDDASLADALERALGAPLPRTLPPARRPSPTTSGVRRSGSRRSFFEPREILEPDLDEGPHTLLDARRARHLERLLPVAASLLRRAALLDGVVAGDEEPLDLRPRLVPGRHVSRLPQPGSTGWTGRQASIATIAR